MTDLLENSSLAGVAADVHIPEIGPLESRRARRERREAAEAQQEADAADAWEDSPTEALEEDSFEITPPRSVFAFGDELAVARERKHVASASEDVSPGSHQDWGN